MSCIKNTKGKSVKTISSIQVTDGRCEGGILQVSEAYLGPFGHQQMSFLQKVVNYFYQKAPSQMFDWFLNMALGLYAVIGIHIVAPKTI